MSADHKSADIICFKRSKRPFAWRPQDIPLVFETEREKLQGLTIFYETYWSLEKAQHVLMTGSAGVFNGVIIVGRDSINRLTYQPAW